MIYREAYKKYEPLLIKEALRMVELARAKLSGHKVGAATLARNPLTGDVRIFGGNNVEYSVGSKDNIHAEVLAMDKACSEGYTEPIACYVTSTSDLHTAAMCGDCMQLYSYVNPECRIVVIRMDGSTKLNISVKQRNGKWGYQGRAKL